MFTKSADFCGNGLFQNDVENTFGEIRLSADLGFALPLSRAPAHTQDKIEHSRARTHTHTHIHCLYLSLFLCLSRFLSFQHSHPKLSLTQTHADPVSRTGVPRSRENAYRGTSLIKKNPGRHRYLAGSGSWRTPCLVYRGTSLRRNKKTPTRSQVQIAPSVRVSAEPESADPSLWLVPPGRYRYLPGSGSLQRQRVLTLASGLSPLAGTGTLQGHGHGAILCGNFCHLCSNVETFVL